MHPEYCLAEALHLGNAAPNIIISEFFRNKRARVIYCGLCNPGAVSPHIGNETDGAVATLPFYARKCLSLSHCLFCGKSQSISFDILLERTGSIWCRRLYLSLLSLTLSILAVAP